MLSRCGPLSGVLAGVIGIMSSLTVFGAELAPLHVAGPKLLNDRGELVRLRGVNAASMEWTSTGEGHIRETVRVAVRDWRCNVIRLPLSQDRWFGRAPEQKDGGVAYRDLVGQVVAECNGGGAYAILDLHWSDGGEWGRAIGQHRLTDHNSVEFWQDCARAYANRPGVIFDLYNEPHDVSWDVWLRGGPISDNGQNYEAVGMQPLLDAVRAVGAKNLVIVGGLDWAYDLSGILDGRQLRDPDGSGVVYANHAYPFKGDSVARWVAKMERAAQTLPIIVSEFGSAPDGGQGLNGEEWVRQALAALDSHGWSWTAWDMHPHAGPSVIRDFDCTPTPHFGTQIKRSLQSESTPIAVPRTLPGGLLGNSGDVGTVRVAGSTSFDPASDRYTVTGSGKNMWFGTDACQFAWKQVSANEVSLAAGIEFLGEGRNPHRKACLMIRQSLDADSPQVGAVVHGDGLTSLQFRDGVGANTHEVQANITKPKRIELTWRGNYATLALSTADQPLAFSGAATRIGFAAPFYVGIAVCSHEDETAETATFADLTLREGPVSGAAATLAPAGKLVSILETQTISSTDRRVVRVFDGRIEAPNWTRDGLSLLYNAEGRIYRIPVLGGTPTPIDTGTALRCNNDHGISPDGATLAISDGSGIDRKSRIALVPLAGGTPRVVTPDAPSYWHGWSPDGSTLAFCGERGGKFDIYTIPAAGGTETRLTTAEGLDDGPEYSPDGQTIFFNSDRSGLMQILRMNADGSDQKRVFTDERNNWFPHPSPDGKKLVYVSFERYVQGHPADKDVEVRLIDLASRRVDTLARLFGGQGTMNVASWSPDGRRIAFVTYHRVP